MAMVITETIRMQLGGKAFRMFDVDGVDSGATTITAASLDLTIIEMAQWDPRAMTLSAISETPGVLGTNKGENVVYTGLTADSGTLTVIGW